MRKRRLLIIIPLIAVMLLSGCAKKIKLDKENPISIKIWHYYNGTQKIAFDNLVSEFNETEGKNKGIIVEALNYGNIDELVSHVISSANKEAGSDDLPQIFSAYADLAYKVDQMDLLTNLEEYISEKELAEYIDAYIEEGRLGKDEKLKIMPIAKSTEIMLLNKTDWDKFEKATGANLESLETIEGLLETSKNYYQWTDSLTPDVAEDGKAFFGRDAMANYMLIGCKQLGVELFSVDNDGKVSFNFDEKVLKKLWDAYYIPSVKGYFNNTGRFRTDTAKVGDIIGLVGSSTMVTFFPEKVFINDNETYPIESLALPTPYFKDGDPYVVQQGAGMAVIKSTPEAEYASMEFLKWFTEAQRNTEFSKESFYLPVKKEANTSELTHETMPENEKEASIERAFKTSLETVNTKEMYTNKAFKGGENARVVIERSLPDKVKADTVEIDTLIAAGMTREEAVLNYTTDENFQTWLKTLKEALASTQSGI